jgi:hypothetical protein
MYIVIVLDVSVCVCVYGPVWNGMVCLEEDIDVVASSGRLQILEMIDRHAHTLLQAICIASTIDVYSRFDDHVDGVFTFIGSCLF